jgi:hypothetical protein
LLRKVVLGVIIAAVVLGGIGGYIVYRTGIDIWQLRQPQYEIVGILETSASAVTSPPPSMEGINTHTEVYGTGADPDMITLGPKTGGCEGCPPYPGKTSMEFELEHGEPVLAPIDMVFIGFKNRNAQQRTRSDGEVQSPYNDLELCFESSSPDWPGMIICVYHLSTSPLLPGHYEGSDCYEEEEWGNIVQAQGRIYYEQEDFTYRDLETARSCEALIGRTVKRGEVVGYAGSVGDHSMAPFRFKVAHTEENPTVRIGNKYLHWVQPGSFFYWKCYNPETDFPNGVLAYPFVCDGYQLPEDQYDVTFKYTSIKN